MKAVVTGATGLVGSHVIQELLRNSNNFTSILALGRKKIELLQLSQLGVQTEIFDLMSDYSKFSILENWGGTDSIWFHCAAALTGAEDSVLHNVNVEGTRKLIKKAEELKVFRLIHVSSFTIYGLNDIGKFKEDSLAQPASKYGRTKLDAENLIISSQLDWTIFRPPFIGGPFDQNILKEFAKRIEKKKMPEFSKNGKIGYIDARDLANVMVQSVFREIMIKQIYNIQGEEVLLREFINTIGECLKIKPPYGKKYPYSIAMIIGLFAEIYAKIRRKSSVRGISRYRIRTLTSIRTLNDQKIRKEINYAPKYSLKQSIIDWMNNTKP